MGVCRVRALIPAPLPRVWEFIIDPRNLHRWASAAETAEPVTCIDRPLQPGDQVTQWRRRFFRRSSQVLLVEEVVPYRSFRVREMSPKGRRMDLTATLTVEEAAAEPRATWIEEAVSYSLGISPIARWVDRGLVYPLFLVMMRWKGARAFPRLAAILSQGQEGGAAVGRPGSSGA